MCSLATSADSGGGSFLRPPVAPGLPRPVAASLLSLPLSLPDLLPYVSLGVLGPPLFTVLRTHHCI